jgi:hypothetical protein
LQLFLILDPTMLQGLKPGHARDPITCLLNVHTYRLPP